MGDQAFSRCGVQIQGLNDELDLNFENYVFRIIPMLSYRYNNESEAIEAKQRSLSMRMSITKQACKVNHKNQVVVWFNFVCNTHPFLFFFFFFL